MREAKAWIFDLDGTLTLAQHDFVAIREELGIPADEDILSYLKTLPQAQAGELSRQLDAIELRLARDVAAAPGAASLIRHLRDSGKQLGILTRNLQSVAVSSLEVLGIADCFEAEHILGRAEALPKPDPAGIHHLLELWSVEPHEAVMVGDFRFDLEAGRAAGCRTCLLHEHNGWPALADLHLPDCERLLMYLRDSVANP
ncbi:HAD family hydrolase [uncultured Halopseudomonas sp.]|uniref:HAD family hydrolase n=1 Tax=uncultured Halopseudomonas sp. TaxID=2901193 RepID=UPI0030EDB4ED|tara:strand:- start:25936 stop:26535 length:600 start_codon:yes stop_codon:yes gene_type:complete